VTTLASFRAIRNAAAAAVGADARTVEELVDTPEVRDLSLGAEPAARLRDALLDDSRFLELEGGEWVHLPSLLDGTTWTTRLAMPLPSDDRMPVEPDLTMLAWWSITEPIPLAGGGALDAVELDDGSDGLQGPSGWLEPYVGSTLAFAISDGGITLRDADAEPTPTPAQIAAVRLAFAVAAEGESDQLLVALVEDVLVEALVVGRDAFVTDVIPPVDDLFAAAELERFGAQVAVAGFDWDARHLRQEERRLGSRHDLDDVQTGALVAALGASYAFAAGDFTEEPGEARGFTAALTDPGVAHAFFGEHQGRGTDPQQLVAFTRWILDHLDDVPEGDTVGVRWLLARALDHAGDPLAAEAEMERAFASGVDFPPATLALAAFASDRGDAVRADALLRTLDLDDDDPLRLEVEEYASVRPRATVGRNDPCPCGSGRKYKVCHLGRERLPLIDRAPWLYDKACRYLRDGRSRLLSAEVATIVAESSGHFDMVLDMVESPLVADVVLCEAGVFDDFVAERDALLPDDEALLAAQWSVVRRTLFEVERSGRDHVALRDLRTGDRITVTNTYSERETPSGELLLGRPLPVDDTWRAYSGFVPVPDSMRDELLAALDDPDPFVVAALIGRCFAPPTLQNTDGDPLVFHELRYRIRDPHAAHAALVAGGLHDDGDGSFTLVRDSTNQTDTVILAFELAEIELRVTANSDRRAGEARALVASLLPDAVLEDHDVRELDELLADADDEALASPPTPDDPDLAAALDQFVREREQQWVDEPVPMLGGLTPREAALDPIARVELDRLLRRFEDRSGTPGTFDVARLRRVLDLP
jgi:hypothetical protein